MSPEIYNLTKISYKNFLMDAKYSKKFIDELVQSISLVNYGQDVSIPAFVGCVSFAGAGEQLWAIKGGNKLLAKQLAHNSEATISLNTRVNSVTQLDANLFELSVTDEKSGQTSTRRYNSVIIATPLTENQLKFINFSTNFNVNFPKRQYHRTVSTLVAGHLNKKWKGRDVLSDNESTFFTSIGRVYPVDDSRDERTPVYKVFSRTPLTTDQLDLIFEDTQVVYVKDWYAYPHYDSVSEPLPPFILSPGVYHLNAIEWAASAIEMSLIGGKNAALLAYNQLGGKTGDANTYTQNTANHQITDEL
ncbi:unnamed protein product [Medioppia subpectinata]|uniref:Prenylcysteine lyase domain-containing protein n=1 Tax=Medioppia subpectinata TaxID=1979941 RepID=A0A7R9LM00_9ACAR|nr:unnamed protein product [Medioppia subpectinata]CAG2119641.1 unnamed protein product [Medioppia subpectinata]